MRLAFHVDREGLKRTVLACASGPSRETLAEAKALIADAVAAEPVLSRRLVAARMHHELTRLSRMGYRKLIKKLAYGE